VQATAFFWPVVNPTDEDWAGVKMALGLGSADLVQDDLYNPLYVPARPSSRSCSPPSARPPTAAGSAANKIRKERLFSRGFNGPKPPARWRTRKIADGPRGSAVEQGGRGGEALDDAYGLRLSVRPDARGEQFARLQAASWPSGWTSGRSECRDGRGVGGLLPYVVDHPVSLARKKSAMLPIVARTSSREGVDLQPGRPAEAPASWACGSRTPPGCTWPRGPVTVFEGSVYAGDTRVLDVQPGEDRLVSYAIDLGTEVIVQTGRGRRGSRALRR